MGKHSKKHKKHKSHKSKGHSKSRSSSEEEWVEADSVEKSPPSETADDKSTMERSEKREDWMSLPTSFTSFSTQDSSRLKQLEKKMQKEQDQYDPRKSSRELNKYWKDGGDGLPQFQKPREDYDERNERRHRHKSSRPHPSSHQSKWRKSDPKRHTEDPVPSTSKPVTETQVQGKTVTQNDLNLLASKLLKAEIQGNSKLVEELKQQLDQARQQFQTTGQNKEEMLIQNNRQGLAKPLELPSNNDTNDRRRKKATETHTDQKRVRYFADDDKYSLQQMFENEKYNTASDQDATFMKIASKLRKNDDLDDLFADGARRQKSDSKIAEETRNKTINEHKKVSASLDNCSRCIQSSMQKHLIVSMGEYVYLSLPAHQPLLPGHCLIVPIRHCCSITQLDENEWSEMNNFRKALIKLFHSKGQQPVFFEIAVGFHRYPHTILECVPLEKSDASLAPMYFKKAIDESETEWSQNKKLVTLKGRNVRQAIPKELAYFAVDFGGDKGFAHVVEDEKLFPKNFAQEIIGGILDLDHNLWRRPARQAFDVQTKRVFDFSSQWKDFDCTV